MNRSYKLTVGVGGGSFIVRENAGGFMNGLVFHLLCSNVVGLRKEARQAFGS